MEIRLLTAADTEIYRAVRLRAVTEERTAFITSAAEFQRQSREAIAARLRQQEHSPEDFTLGAFVDGQLVGTVTFVRREAEKLRHKGDIYGMYVVPQARRQGVGQALLTEAIQRALARPALEQLLLTVVETQTAARQLYASVGFVTYGREPRAVKVGDRYFDEELMILDLRKQGAK